MAARQPTPNAERRPPTLRTGSSARRHTFQRRSHPLASCDLFKDRRVALGPQRANRLLSVDVGGPRIAAGKVQHGLLGRCGKGWTEIGWDEDRVESIDIAHDETDLAFSIGETQGAALGRDSDESTTDRAWQCLVNSGSSQASEDGYTIPIERSGDGRGGCFERGPPLSSEVFGWYGAVDAMCESMHNAAAPHAGQFRARMGVHLGKVNCSDGPQRSASDHTKGIAFGVHYANSSRLAYVLHTHIDAERRVVMLLQQQKVAIRTNG